MLTVNRPERANSQTQRMFHDHGEAALALRDSGARALILRGAGERAFCSGFDLAEVAGIREMAVREFLFFQEVATGGLAAIRELPTHRSVPGALRNGRDARPRRLRDLRRTPGLRPSIRRPSARRKRAVAHGCRPSASGTLHV